MICRKFDRVDFALLAVTAGGFATFILLILKGP
jgi:hypothetical protein